MCKCILRTTLLSLITPKLKTILFLPNFFNCELKLLQIPFPLDSVHDHKGMNLAKYSLIRKIYKLEKGWVLKIWENEKRKSSGCIISLQKRFFNSYPEFDGDHSSSEKACWKMQFDTKVWALNFDIFLKSAHFSKLYQRNDFIQRGISTKFWITFIFNVFSFSDQSTSTTLTLASL